MSTKASLEKIVQRAQSLNQNVSTSIPKIRRNPQQLHEASLKLASQRPLDERTKSRGYGLQSSSSAYYHIYLYSY